MIGHRWIDTGSKPVHGGGQGPESSFKRDQAVVVGTDVVGLAQIVSSREMSTAYGGEDHSSDVVVVLTHAPSRVEFACRLVRDHVGPVRIVNRDGGNIAGGFEIDWHGMLKRLEYSASLAACVTISPI